MIPQRMLSQTVTIIRPAVATDVYGNETFDYDNPASTVDVAAWLQQDNRTEPVSDGRAPLVGRWLMVTNHVDVRGRDRVTWTGPAGTVTFEVDGPPEPAYDTAGWHHVEATLKVVNG